MAKKKEWPEYGSVYQKGQVCDMNIGQALGYQQQQQPHTIKRINETF